MKFRLFPGILIIALLSFMIFIVSIGILFSRRDPGIVVKDYYKEEVKYQETINEMGNTHNLDDSLTVTQQEETLLLHFPSDFEGKELTGEIYLYRPSDAKMDIKVPLNPDALQQVVPVGGLAKGLWRVKVRWQSNGKTYYNEQKIMLI